MCCRLFPTFDVVVFTVDAMYKVVWVVSHHCACCIHSWCHVQSVVGCFLLLMLLCSQLMSCTKCCRLFPTFDVVVFTVDAMYTLYWLCQLTSIWMWYMYTTYWFGYMTLYAHVNKFWLCNKWTHLHMIYVLLAASNKVGSLVSSTTHLELSNIKMFYYT